MASSRTARVWLVLGVALGVIAGAVIFFKQWLEARPDPDARDSQSMPTERARPKAVSDRSAEVLRPGQGSNPEAMVSNLIRESLESFRLTDDRARQEILLRTLREGIRAAPEEAAAAALVKFLKSRDDAPTGLTFAVGADGMMDQVPTVRQALLDLLPSLDPTAALTVAREIMDQRTSPDEYALALRNLAWNDLDGDLRDELSRRFLDLLKTPWLDQPSAGFLEAFDIAVEVGGVPMFEQMVGLADATLAENNSAASRAVFMSLDRMIVRNPSLLTTVLAADWMDFAPQQRASLMSRLDVTEPAQREVFKRYLGSTAHGTGELDYFAKIFPNGNFLYGHRLVTTDDATPTIHEILAADARVIAELETITSSVAGNGADAIRKIRERLRGQRPTR